MKARLKLFYAPNEQQYYIYYSQGFNFVLYKVENINPLNVMPEDSLGIHPSEKKLMDQVEEFAKKEFEKMNDGF